MFEPSAHLAAAKSLLTRTSLMYAQLADLTRKFGELEANLKTLINDLADEDRRQRHAA